MSDNHAHGGVRKLVMIFLLLLVVTFVEVMLGIYKSDLGALLNEPGGFTSWLNIIFILLTLVKAYYIVEVFMHLEGERKNLRLSIYLPVLILIPYLTFILLTEGSHLFGV
ncbi:MAG: cytochrome C oxidase subunit IV [Bacteroidetes bacterium]|uniref:Cytochrome C oxidase subunit IV family protein n=1 Tax=Phaeocystidibacter marisrubri TaxID=1577780 RepID=A0A6L3ZH84_9FLAO|nr:cytochrome C oxidase subunit IV family protein [Phaeocystidibacter marisrubri]KAB2816938.1 cytochrome C oxidase subunit IV family protein [Phaeocystidibacter marisrubri]TNE27574.1 MAG: cytochrome C oxidase subunit IV [Bacteroidota bacterium]GGH77517.1 cytochrome c oxidase subunit IV [Phaeocystidibacter marisrubri]